MDANEKAKKLQKELGAAQRHYADIANEYHLASLLPTMPDDAMLGALDYYKVMIMSFLKFMSDFNKYYSGRGVVKSAYTENLLKITDEIEKMLDTSTVDLSYLEGDYGVDGKTQ